MFSFSTQIFVLVNLLHNLNKRWLKILSGFVYAWLMRIHRLFFGVKHTAVNKMLKQSNKKDTKSIDKVVLKPFCAWKAFNYRYKSAQRYWHDFINFVPDQDQANKCHYNILSKNTRRNRHWIQSTFTAAPTTSLSLVTTQNEKETTTTVKVEIHECY